MIYYELICIMITQFCRILQGKRLKLLSIKMMSLNLRFIIEIKEIYLNIYGIHNYLKKIITVL